MTQEEAQRMLIGLVEEEVTTHELGQLWITDKVGINWREMIKQCRKNYWGVHDKPLDPVTKKEKLWIPLTRLLCDSVRVAVNRGPKDVRFRSKKARQYDMTQIARGFVRNWMSKTYFNHTLDQTTTTIVIDGTDVWKTYFDGEKIIRKDVDLLNVYIDPSSDSIQDAYRFTERALFTKQEMAAMDDWINTSDFAVDVNLEREDNNATRRTGAYGDVYESWGKFPANLIYAAMGQDYDDEDESEIDAQVVISGLNTGTTLFHYAAENTNKDKNGNIIKPYEECWYLKIPGCWYGLGIAYTVMPIQTWINTIINLRINKNTIAQLGLLKIRRGAGVSQHMLTQLIANGVIELNDPVGDLDQLRIDESGQSSYEDEKVAKQWAQEVSKVFDINLGDLPASTSATGAAIQSQQANSAATLTAESIEHFIQRWMDRHFLVHIPEMVKAEGYATIFREFDDIKRIRERVISNIAMERLEEMMVVGQYPTEENLLQELQRAQRQLEEDGDLFIEVMDEILAESLDTEVFMTNAEIDVGVTVRNLLELRNGMPPEVFAEMTAEALDLLGLEVPQALRNPTTQQPGQEQQPQPQQPGIIPPTDAALQTSANTLNSEQR